MALAETTLSSAAAQADNFIVVASATAIAAGVYFQIDGEVMQATKGYVAASTTVPVTRGLQGTAQVAHLNTARVVHGTAADWGGTGAGAITSFAPVGRPRRIRSYRTTADMDLPAPGEDLLVRLDSTAFTLTVPVPSLNLDGSEVVFVGSTGAAYVLEFTGGLGGAGSGYETVTFNATGGICFRVVAMNQTWNAVAAMPITGTTANVTAALA